MNASTVSSIMNMITKGGRVARFHTKPILKEETVAQHSYLVAWLAVVYYNAQGAEPSQRLLLACLSHDTPEYVLGDMPSPAKKLLGLKPAFRHAEAAMFAAAGMPDYEGLLSQSEADVLSFCDNLAGYLKCCYEVQLGNGLMIGTKSRYKEYIAALVTASTFLNASVCSTMLSYTEQAD